MSSKLVAPPVDFSETVIGFSGSSRVEAMSDASVRAFDAMDVVANPLAGFEAGFFFFLPPAMVESISPTLSVLTWGKYLDGGAFFKFLAPAPPASEWMNNAPVNACGLLQKQKQIVTSCMNSNMLAAYSASSAT